MICFLLCKGFISAFSIIVDILKSQLFAAAILLTHMPESYVFATIREAINDSSHFLPLSQKAYYSWCKTYSYFVERLFPATYKVMEKCGALDPRSGLDPIFKRFFITLLKREVSRLLETSVLRPSRCMFLVNSPIVFAMKGCSAVHGYIHD